MCLELFCRITFTGTLKTKSWFNHGTKTAWLDWFGFVNCSYNPEFVQLPSYRTQDTVAVFAFTAFTFLGQYS